MLKNSSYRYGTVTIVVHWIAALVVIGQFCFGLYMVSLDYYDPNYQALPHYHKSIGVLFALLLLFRILWNLGNLLPGPAAGVAQWEHRIARLMQVSMLTLLLAIVVLGYLISTADGKSIQVFDWFEVPAAITSIENQEDWAGYWHYWLAVSLMVLAGLHALAALKHHFINHDATLLRMLGKTRDPEKN